MDTIDRTAGPAEAAARLLTWLSPSFPVGAFSYSHGLEQAVEAGVVRDHATLIPWIDGILRFGAGRLDGMLLLEAHRAVTLSDAERLQAAAALGAAMRGSAELALESTAQGNAFWKAIGAGWPRLAEAPILRQLAKGPALAYPITVGAVTAVAGIAEESVLYAYLTAFCGILISSAQRLLPIGQSQGLAAIAILEPTIGHQVAVLRAAPFETLGSMALMVDWCSMKHETQETRLFRS
ncbi:MAG TPA: urease accessory UreF family protein [Dongiaceae bacterium]|jgi:urease accessory protein|nr:urease accessory UreF family protein [Dongiaceae bacterium]